MLKRIAITSAIVLAVCMVAFAVMLPIGMAETVKLVENTAAVYSVTEEILSQSPGGANCVRIAGRYAHLIEVRPSVDDKIRVLTNGYHIRHYEVKAQLVNDSCIEITLSGNRGGFSALTRENITKFISAGFGGGEMQSFVVELPANVALDLTENQSNNYSYINVDSRVAVIEREKDDDDDYCERHDEFWDSGHSHSSDQVGQNTPTIEVPTTSSAEPQLGDSPVASAPSTPTASSSAPSTPTPDVTAPPTTPPPTNSGV